MAIVELVGAGNIKFTKLTASAHHEFLADFATALSECPYPGQSHPEFPLLRVASVELVSEGPATGVNEFGTGTCELRRILVDYEFSYRDIPLGDEPKITHTGTVEVMNTCGGRIRDVDGTPISTEDLTTATMYPQDTFNLDCAVVTDPLPTIIPLVGSINDAPFTPVGGSLTFDTGTLLFLDYEIQYQYDYETATWYYRLTYKLLYRGIVDCEQHTHNESYFPPVYERHKETGDIQYYQDQDAGLPNYVDPGGGSAALANTPVYMAGKESGVWSTTTPKNYPATDWTALPLQEARP
jgi:hypothetical protein